MVWVFKTTVQQNKEAEQCKVLLQSLYPDARITFDLEDCDKVLRIDNAHLSISQVKAILQQLAFTCEELE